MRISLVDRDSRDRKRRKSRRRRGHRRNYTFDSAIARPEGLTKRRPSPRHAPSRRQRAALRVRREGMEGEPRTSLWKRIRWRSLLVRLPVLLILAALISGIVYTSTDASFFVYEAHVAGSRHVSPEQIYGAAQVHEQNIFWIQPEKVAERVAEIPGVKAARVRCELPARVTISVEEREPIIMWRTLKYGGDWWLDEDGTVLPYHGDTTSPNTLFVVDSSQRQLEVGDRIEPKDIVHWVQKLAASLPGAKVFYYQADRGLNFTQERGEHKWLVYVGDGQDLSRKIQAVQVLADHLIANSIQATFIDVRWPELPVYGQARQPEVETEE